MAEVCKSKICQALSCNNTNSAWTLQHDLHSLAQRVWAEGSSLTGDLQAVEHRLLTYNISILDLILKGGGKPNVCGIFRLPLQPKYLVVKSGLDHWWQVLYSLRRAAGSRIGWNQTRPIACISVPVFHLASAALGNVVDKATGTVLWALSVC